MIDNSKSKSYPRTSSAIHHRREEFSQPRVSQSQPEPSKKAKVLKEETPIRQGKKTVEDAPTLGEEQAP